MKRYKVPITLFLSSLNLSEINRCRSSGFFSHYSTILVPSSSFSTVTKTFRYVKKCIMIPTSMQFLMHPDPLGLWGPEILGLSEGICLSSKPSPHAEGRRDSSVYPSQWWFCEDPSGARSDETRKLGGKVSHTSFTEIYKIGPFDGPQRRTSKYKMDIYSGKLSP